MTALWRTFDAAALSSGHDHARIDSVLAKAAALLTQLEDLELGRPAAWGPYSSVVLEDVVQSSLIDHEAETVQDAGYRLTDVG